MEFIHLRIKKYVLKQGTFYILIIIFIFFVNISVVHNSFKKCMHLRIRSFSLNKVITFYLN